MSAIIQSLLDTDLYKFTMLQVVLQRFPNTQTVYRFACRNNPVFPLAEIAGEVRAELDNLGGLAFRPEELDYLRSLRYMKPEFVDYLELFRLRPRFIRAEPSKTVPGALDIVAEGPMPHAMMFEIYALAIVNELYCRRVSGPGTLDEGRGRLAVKIAMLKKKLSGRRRANPFEFFDFGTRRRHSRAWQEEALRTLMQELPDCFRGTSNVDLARRLGLTPIGTMAHEYLQVHQALDYRLRDFQKAAFENWADFYRGDLGIALTDVVGMDAFLRDFDLFLGKLFDGVRHDSGDPEEWGEKMLAHYARLRIDARAKRLVFSDGLNPEKAVALYRRFADRTQVGFGIGTNLTNDVGQPPLNIVMKLVEANGHPVAKLSDSPGKTMCDDETFLAYLRQVFQLPGN